MVAPSDGTQDRESSRTAISEAFAEVLDVYPDADLTDLQEVERNFLVEVYISGEIYQRIVLDVGGAILANAPDLATASTRLAQMNDYVRQTVSSALRNARIGGEQIGPTSIAAQVQATLRETFAVFEEYTS